jgi:hypothetical protein
VLTAFFCEIGTSLTLGADDAPHSGALILSKLASDAFVFPEKLCRRFPGPIVLVFADLTVEIFLCRGR